MSKIEVPCDGFWYEPMGKTVPQAVRVLSADVEKADDWRHANLLVVDYQPGNGTKYIVTFVKLPAGDAADAMGAYVGDSHLMIVHNMGSRRAVTVGEYTQYNDIQEKLKLGNTDNLALLCLIRYMAGDMDNLTFENHKYERAAEAR